MVSLSRRNGPPCRYLVHIHSSTLYLCFIKPCKPSPSQKHRSAYQLTCSYLRTYINPHIILPPHSHPTPTTLTTPSPRNTITTTQHHHHHYDQPKNGRTPLHPTPSHPLPPHLLAILAILASTTLQLLTLTLGFLTTAFISAFTISTLKDHAFSSSPRSQKCMELFLTLANGLPYALFLVGWIEEQFYGGSSEMGLMRTIFDVGAVVGLVAMGNLVIYGLVMAVDRVLLSIRVRVRGGEGGEGYERIPDLEDGCSDFSHDDNDDDDDDNDPNGEKNETQTLLLTATTILHNTITNAAARISALTSIDEEAGVENQRLCAENATLRQELQKLQVESGSAGLAIRMW